MLTHTEGATLQIEGGDHRLGAFAPPKEQSICAIRQGRVLDQTLFSHADLEANSLTSPAFRSNSLLQIMINKPDDSIVLLIDADNAPSAKIEFIMTELASHGIANIRRAYGNWTKAGLQGWSKELQEHAIEPVQLFDLVKGKNATDMRLVIDAMDLLYTKTVQTFAIVSSDCDFTPLCTRLRAEGKKVIGFGGHNTPAPFINSCTNFLYLDDDEKDAAERKAQRTSPDQLKGNTKLMNTLRSAIEACADEDGWAPLGPVGNHLSNQGSLDHRTFGFAKLSGLLGAIDLFEMEKNTNGTQGYRVRQRPKGGHPKKEG